MIDVSVPGRVNRNKVKRFTRRHLHQEHLALLRERRTAAREDKRRAMASARRDARKLSIFEGCAPERTEALCQGR